MRREISKDRIERYTLKSVPGSRVDVTDKHSFVVTSMDGRRKVVTIKKRIAEAENDWIIDLVYQAVPAMIAATAAAMLVGYMLACWGSY